MTGVSNYIWFVFVAGCGDVGGDMSEQFARPIASLQCVISRAHPCLRLLQSQSRLQQPRTSSLH